MSAMRVAFGTTADPIRPSILVSSAESSETVAFSWGRADLFVRWESDVYSPSSANSRCFQQLSRWKEGPWRRPAVPMLKGLSDRREGDSVPKLAWPEFDSFAPVEDAGCLKNWWGNLSVRQTHSICRRGG